jgi:hypothetical protein
MHSRLGINLGHPQPVAGLLAQPDQYVETFQLRRYSVVRLLDFLMTNESTGYDLRLWTDGSRSNFYYRPTHGAWGHRHVVPIAHCAEICNLAKVRPWINIPDLPLDQILPFMLECDLDFDEDPIYAPLNEWFNTSFLHSASKGRTYIQRNFAHAEALRQVIKGLYTLGRGQLAVETQFYRPDVYKHLLSIMPELRDLSRDFPIYLAGGLYYGHRIPLNRIESFSQLSDQIRESILGEFREQFFRFSDFAFSNHMIPAAYEGGPHMPLYGPAGAFLKQRKILSDYHGSAQSWEDQLSSLSNWSASHGPYCSYSLHSVWGQEFWGHHPLSGGDPFPSSSPRAVGYLRGGW